MTDSNKELDELVKLTEEIGGYDLGEQVCRPLMENCSSPDVIPVEDPPIAKVEPVKPAPAKKVEPVKEQPLKVPGDALKRIKPQDLYPPFLAQVKLLLENCAKRGAIYYAISGERTWDEQNALYRIGRTEQKNRKPVTNARAGESSHNYALAVDFCRDKDVTKDGLQPEWDMKSYLILAEEAKKLGMDSAYWWKSFKEGAHVQLNIGSRKIPLSKLKELYLQGGKKRVFDYLNQYHW